MLFNDRTSIILTIIGAVFFIVFCLIDVSGIFPAMDNLAIRIIIIGIYTLILFNLISAHYISDDVPTKNLPESEEHSSDYRQM